jgi:hypothetical protein
LFSANSHTPERQRKKVIIRNLQKIARFFIESMGSDLIDPESADNRPGVGT